MNKILKRLIHSAAILTIGPIAFVVLGLVNTWKGEFDNYSLNPIKGLEDLWP